MQKPLPSHIDWQTLPEQLPPLLLPLTPALPASRERQAAVLLLWCENGGAPFTLLTQRSAELPLHPGQISLPGGRVEASDASLELTALREAHEEVGLPAAAVRLLGRLPTASVSSGFTITPVVGYCTSRPTLQPNQREVARLIELPLSLALDCSRYGQDSLERDGETRQFRFLQFEEHFIWGATARILLTLAERVAPLLQSPNSR
ncbi:MAG: CoA pyrophosphatase [Pseudohongiellaceae bacterium]|jgi:8-oxo-dGTP pyrophosphatase MutT (NUDIX family)